MWEYLWKLQQVAFVTSILYTVLYEMISMHATTVSMTGFLHPIIIPHPSMFHHNYWLYDG